MAKANPDYTEQFQKILELKRKNPQMKIADIINKHNFTIPVKTDVGRTAYLKTCCYVISRNVNHRLVK